MADDALFVRRDDQVMHDGWQFETGAQFGDPVPGAAVWREDFDKDQGVGGVSGVSWQSWSAAQQGVGLEIVVFNPDRDATDEDLAGGQSRCFDGPPQSIDRRGLAQIVRCPFG